jgi:hypothetical protein
MSGYHYFVAHEFSKQDTDDLRTAIEEAFKSLELEAYYADLEVRQSHILEKIKDMILHTQFGIYDISNTTKPNVFIELGLAMAFGKAFYIICKKGTTIPADLAGLDRIEYESYKQLTKVLDSVVVNIIKKPQIKITRPRLEKKNSWSLNHIKEWLKQPIGSGGGKNDYLYELHGKVYPTPMNTEVRIWIFKEKLWPQIGDKVSASDGTWTGRIYLKREKEMKKIDIGIDLFKDNDETPYCSEIFTIE